MTTDYRIEFTITRCLDSENEDDFAEIGFGSSGACHDIDGCAFAIESLVSHGQWETTGDHPDPDDVMADIAREREAAS